MGPVLSPTGAARGGRAAAPRGNKGPRGPSNPDGGCRDPARSANVRSEPAGLSPKELRPLPVWSWSFQVPRKSNSVPFPVNDPGLLAGPLSPLHVFPAGL